MAQLTTCEFGVVADTGLRIDGQVVTESKSVTVDIDPCRIDEVIEELKGHYLAAGFNGNIELIHEMCETSKSDVTES